MVKKYIHIGYPKNFSTSLQRDFFGVHPELYHLGIGVGSNIGYIDNTMSSLFEVFLKYSKGFSFDSHKEKLKASISDHLSLAEITGKKAVTVSSEHLSFSFLPESIDFETKLRRLIYLFGQNISFIVVIRNQKDLIKSIYKEYVRNGMVYSFSEFIYSLYKFQDRNLYYDLRYDLLMSKLLEYFPKDNIHFLQFENYKSVSKNSITNEFSDIMEVSRLDRPIEHFNKALSENELAVKLKLNQNNQHDLGNGIFESAEIHRQVSYFTQILELEKGQEDFFKDVKMKRRMIAASKLDLSEFEGLSSIDFSCDETIMNSMSSFYNEGNEKFENLSGIKLMDQYKCFQSFQE